MTDELPIVFCEGCGTVHTEATAQMRETMEDLEQAKDELLQKGKRIKSLQRERSRNIETDPHYSDVVMVLEHWREVCAPRAREPLSEPRAKAVLGRLKGGYFVSELMRCNEGYARFPYYVRGRRCAFGDEQDRMTEAEFMFGKARDVDRGITMANAPEGAGTVPSAAFVARVPWDKVWRENRRLITAALQRRFGGPIEGFRAGQQKWPCPFCELEEPHAPGAEPSSLLVDNTPGSSIVSCYRCGITDARILAAITDVEGLI